jgi:hypothetical protein
MIHKWNKHFWSIHSRYSGTGFLIIQLADSLLKKKSNFRPFKNPDPPPQHNTKNISNLQTLHLQKYFIWVFLLIFQVLQASMSVLNEKMCSIVQTANVYFTKYNTCDARCNPEMQSWYQENDNIYNKILFQTKKPQRYKKLENAQLLRSVFAKYFIC